MDKVDTSLQQIWDFLSVNDAPSQVDVIFLFGSQDSKSPLRAAELYRNSYSSKILVTGGFGTYTKDKYQEPEAILFGKKLLELGIPSEDIILETEATNTSENIQLGMKELYALGIEVKSVILVNRPFMMKRTVATFKKLYPQVSVLSCPTEYTLQEYTDWMDEKTKGRASERLKSEIVRLLEYPKLGYIEAVDIPKGIISTSTER